MFVDVFIGVKLLCEGFVFILDIIVCKMVEMVFDKVFFGVFLGIGFGGGFLSGIGKIFGFVNGIWLVSGGLVMVGECGLELVNFLKGLRVYIV